MKSKETNNKLMVTFEKKDIIESDSAVKIIGLFEDYLPEKTDKILIASGTKKQLEKLNFQGKIKEELLLPSDKGNLLLIGFGKKASFNIQLYRNMLAQALNSSKKRKFNTISIELPSVFEPEIAGYEASFVSVVVNYDFSQYKAEKNDTIKIVKIHSKSNIAKNIEEGRIVGEAVNLSRTLGNLPPSVGTPTYFEKEARKIEGIKITVLGREDFIKLGMGGLEGVSRAAREPAKLVIMEYKNSESKPELLVGKGITFDSGGLSIKSTEGMEDMKFDKCGAAAVLGAMKAISESELKVHVVGIMPLTENLPGGNAYKPGDILKHYNGKTSEILSTDAEGRLILADALAYGTEKYDPAHVIDLATLTGACVVALGDNIAGIISNNQDFQQKMIDVSKRTWEKLWPLPLDEEFKEQIKSDVADIKNTGGRPGGAETAAAFLSNFVGEKPWIHLDIAGTASTKKNLAIFTKGATGFGTRLLYEYLKSIS
ncbi:MAG: leucyl aminopeptidase [Thermoplasmata archaeon]